MKQLRARTLSTTRRHIFPPPPLWPQPPFLTVARARSRAWAPGARGGRGRADGACAPPPLCPANGTPFPRPTFPAHGPEVGPCWHAARVPSVSFVLRPGSSPGRPRQLHQHQPSFIPECRPPAKRGPAPTPPPPCIGSIWEWL